MPKPAKDKKEILQTPKGTRDILPSEAVVWQAVEAKAREIAEFYGFRPIRTPHFERTELFTTGVGEATDIVEKQMYTFRTRGKDSLTLRPEGTAPLMRTYIQHGMRTWSQPVMLYYMGSFFRHERPQKGRYREFGQFGLEVLGTDGAVADALIIRLFTLIFEELGFKKIVVHVNTLGDKVCRDDYRKDLVLHFRKKQNYLCKDCKRRLKTNPLRVLDCTEEKCREIAEDAPQFIEYVCDACKEHFREVLEFLDKAGIPYFLNHKLVRGLDYYSRTVFEIFVDGKEEKEKKEEAETPKAVEVEGEKKKDEEVHPPQEEKQEDKKEKESGGRLLALASGGRYDSLAYDLGMKEPKTEEEAVWKGAAGGAIGLDRVVEEMLSRKNKGIKQESPRLFFIQLGPQAKQQSFLLLEQFRKARLSVASSLSKDSIKNQLKHAAQLGVSHSIILGQKEAIDNTVIVRDMDTGMQEIVPQEKLLDYLKKKKKNK